MRNKFAILLFLLMGLITNACGQGSNEIEDAIKNLTNSETKENSLIFLSQLIRENPEKLAAFSGEIGKILNKELKDSEFDFGLTNLALELYQNKLLVLGVDAEKNLVEKHQQMRSRLKQGANYHSWIWNNEEYLDVRTNSGLLLDLFGYGQTDESKNELVNSISFFSDTRLKYFALSSAHKRGHQIETKDIQEIAAEDETRGLIYNYLKSTGNLNLFPNKFNNQTDLSKSDMVNWLTFPTELARVPTKIELIKVFTIEYDDVGPADFYLWKFMADDDTWKDEGWMVGLSGAFIRSETPTMDSYGYTFSAFTKFEEKTPEDHFEYIIGIMEDWNSQND